MPEPTYDRHSERALLWARDQELGHLRAQFEALQDDRLELALGHDSDTVSTESTQTAPARLKHTPWWALWRRAGSHRPV